MKILSRNVNGIRAVVQKGFVEMIESESPDIICLQEVKSFVHQIPKELISLSSMYDFVWHAGERPGYAGTAIFWKKNIMPIATYNVFPCKEFHIDGRVVAVDFGDFVLINVYFPNGSPRSDGTEMLGYKLSFYDYMLSYTQSLQAQNKKVIVTGDFNICHTAQDIARAKENENSIGFLPIERQKIGGFFEKGGFIDGFRKFVPIGDGHYTRRSYRAGARPRNVGRRLDYFAIDAALDKEIKSVTHLTDVHGSDHCPISLIVG